MRRAGQGVFEHRGDAVCGNHIEPDARTHDDAGSFRGFIVGVRAFEDLDLARDVEVMRAAQQAGRHHRLRGLRERPRAVEHEIDAVQVARDRGRVVEQDDAGAQAELFAERLDRKRASASDDG